MKKHRPNVVPLKTRRALIFSILILLTFIFAELATGYTYLPGKRGGILLSGTPTLMIVLASSALCLAALLTIVDHYDKRANEAIYKSIKAVCYKSSLFLLVTAPAVEFIEQFLILSDVNLFPKFHGIAEKYTFYSPTFKKYIGLLEPVFSIAPQMAIAAFGSIGIALLIKKYFPGTRKKLVAILLSIGMLGLSSLWLVEATKDFLSGEVKMGRRTYKYVVVAENEPAKFNAILLSSFSMGGVMFLASLVVLVGVATNRIKPPE